MPLVRKSLRLPYQTGDLFDLVCDVESYPSFIHWVKRLNIENQSQNNHIWQARARTTVAFATSVQNFSTDIVADKEKSTIKVDLVDGPFKHLRNTWTFSATADGSLTCFNIDFQFKNSLLRALSILHADRAGQILASRFVDEARRRYGQRISGYS